MKYEGKTNSKLNSHIDFWWLITTTKKDQTTQVKSMFLATLEFQGPQKTFLPPILIWREKISKLKILLSGFKTGYRR